MHSVCAHVYMYVHASANMLSRTGVVVIMCICACVCSVFDIYWAMSAVNLLSVKSMEEIAMAELKYCWNTGATDAATPFL